MCCHVHLKYSVFSCLISDKCSHLCAALLRDGTVLPKSSLQCIRTSNKVGDLFSLFPLCYVLQRRFSIANCVHVWGCVKYIYIKHIWAILSFYKFIIALSTCTIPRYILYENLKSYVQVKYTAQKLNNLIWINVLLKKSICIYCS